MKWNTNMPLIGILRGITPAEVHDHVTALLDAGFDAVEIPLNSPQWEVSIAQTVAEFGHRALIGAGTVLKPEQLDALHSMGSKLVVTPNTQPAVIRRAVELGMTVCAGCATASEAFTALDAGAQALKIFPSVSFGPDYIKALKAVLPLRCRCLPLVGLLLRICLFIWLRVVLVLVWAVTFTVQANRYLRLHNKRLRLLKPLRMPQNENYQANHLPFTPTLDVSENRNR